jgi:hypothetical protein
VPDLFHLGGQTGSVIKLAVMEMTYRVVPRGRSYRVEAVAPNKTILLVAVWPTEDMAVSHLKELQRRAQLEARPMNPGERDWRG